MQRDVKEMHKCTGNVKKCYMQNEEVTGKVHPQPMAN